jgi:hypothetical protein
MNSKTKAALIAAFIVASASPAFARHRHDPTRHHTTAYSFAPAHGETVNELIWNDQHEPSNPSGSIPGA